MTLTASGAISMSNINTEIGQNINTINDGRYRFLVGKTSGAVKYSDGYGKTAKFTGNITMDASTRSSAGISGQPFYSTTFNEVMRNGATGNAEVHFNGTPAWPGDIIIRNNSTGVQSQLTPITSVNWAGSNPANLLRASTTDNFTIRPV